MLEEAQRLNDPIDLLLSLARVEGGRLPLRREAIHLDELAAGVWDRVGVLAADDRIDR